MEVVMKMNLRHSFVSFSLFPLFLVSALLSPDLSFAQAGGGEGSHREPFEPEMVSIKGGLFFMGSQDGMTNERPVHAVVVSDFEIGKYEITNDEFAAFVEDTGYVTEAEKLGSGRIARDRGFGYYPGFNWREWNAQGSNLEGRGRQPVVQVSWNDALSYCRWLSEKTGHPYRLPTEAEWEYACRGGTQTRYWWGDSFDQTKVNTMGMWISSSEEPWPKEGHTLTTEVDAYTPNPFGLHDMIGNLWEWVADYAADDYYLQLVRLKESPAVDPQGPANGINRSMRGGGWHAIAPRCRCAYRYTQDPPSYRSDHTGFRVVRTP
jgi:formylglycine-generating enzyme required for sulfatase activity